MRPTRLAADSPPLRFGERLTQTVGMRKPVRRCAVVLVVFMLLEALCVGMGLPIFCILLGLPVGRYIAKRIALFPFDGEKVYRTLLKGALSTSSVTFIGMLLLWDHCFGMLFDPSADISDFGILMILYEPTASLLGWLILMIVISPFLQLLMTLFGAHMTLMRRFSKNNRQKTETASLPG